MEADPPCRLEQSPCSKGTRRAVYDNARRCKEAITLKCKRRPDKKTWCEASKEGISRLRKKQLCTYILKNPAYRAEGHVLEKNFVAEPRRNFGATIQKPFFTPMTVNWSKLERGTIQDAQRMIYLARYSGPKTVVYSQKGDSKVHWTNFDEDAEEFYDRFQLTWPDQFESFLRKAKRRGIEQIYLYVRLFARLENRPEKDTSRHANFLFFDLKNKLLYRYEPSGFSMYDVFLMDSMDIQLKAFAARKGLKYVPPWDSCPTQLLAKVAQAQRQAGLAKREATDPGGFCKVWSTFVMEQKLRHPEMDFNEIHRYFTKLFLEQNIDITHFARMYIQRINQWGDNILAMHGYDEDDEMDKDEYLEEHFESLMEMAMQ
jgi:hypothetical protein